MFDPLTQILPGRHAIEASAGTGKTYSITLLWLRLLLEHKLTVDQVLVSTFTNAATGELSERLLTSLQGAYGAAKALAVGSELPDTAEAKVVRQALQQGQRSPAELMTQLAEALSAFDLAPICTLHGFCQSLIKRHSLELGCQSDVQLVTDCDELLHQVVDDVLMQAAPTFDLNVKDLRNLAKVCSRHSNAEWALPKEITKEQMQLALAKLPDEVPLPPRTNAAIAKAIQKQLTNLRSNVDVKAWSDAQLKVLPADFLELWEMVLETRRNYLLAPTIAVANAVKNDFPKRKTAAALRSFDDILLTVHHALDSEVKPDTDQLGPLTRAVRKRFAAVIIDECQDSDGVQIKVFERLFGAPDAVQSFIVIGDPKQSIYRFRGADLASYQDLAGQATRADEMTVNYRSDQPLISALNALYQRADSDQRFEFPNSAGRTHPNAICYVPVTAQASDARLHDPLPRPALVWHSVNETDRQKAKLALAQQVALECERLLASSVTLEDRDTGLPRLLHADDIAVLAGSHKELKQVRFELQKRGIATQIAGSSLGRVYDSDEALDVLAWLNLLAAAQDGHQILDALLTHLGSPLGAWATDTLVDLRADVLQQAEVLNEYRDAAQSLGRLGPLPLLVKTLSLERVQQSNLQVAGGERRYSNWRQLGALLQTQWSKGRTHPALLARWLEQQRASEDGTDTDETMMRLETDAPAVVLCTVHAAKGLEWPLVFCPYLWSVRSRVYRRKTPSACVRNEQGWLLDIGSGQFDAHLDSALNQEDEEDHRKLYVALTRARHRLYVGLAPVEPSNANSCNGYVQSALAQLPGAPALDDIALHSEILASQNPATGGKGTADASPAPLVTTVPLIAPPVVQIYRGILPRMASYSSLIRSEPDEVFAPDHDAEFASLGAENQQADLAGPDLLKGLGQGAAFGDQVHQVLEAVLGNQLTLEQALKQQQCDAETWQPALAALLQAPLLLPDVQKKPSLSDLQSKCIAEMQFLIPVQRLSPARLSQVFLADPAISSEPDSQTWAQRIDEWRFTDLQGYLIGFMDLVFEWDGRWYVADYKTNLLDSYATSALNTAMLKENYLLQARLYALALHRHLTANMPGYQFETHFGGVAYLFLRGFPGAGAWFERPTATAMQSLDALFAPQAQPFQPTFALESD